MRRLLAVLGTVLVLVRAGVPYQYDSIYCCVAGTNVLRGVRVARCFESICTKCLFLHKFVLPLFLRALRVERFGCVRRGRRFLVVIITIIIMIDQSCGKIDFVFLRELFGRELCFDDLSSGPPPRPPSQLSDTYVNDASMYRMLDLRIIQGTTEALCVTRNEQSMLLLLLFFRGRDCIEALYVRARVLCDGHRSKLCRLTNQSLLQLEGSR